MTTTNTLNEQTKEGFSVWAKAEKGDVYHYVARDERLTFLAENEILVTVEDAFIKKGIAIVKVTLGYKSDFQQGVGSCRIANPNTEDHLGLAYKKAVDNALVVMGVGLTLKNGKPISSLNRGLTPEEVVDAAMNSELP